MFHFTILVIILISLQSCSYSKYMPVKDVVVDDGVNIKEAQSLANDYINKHRNGFCKYVYFENTKMVKNDWVIELTCDSANNPGPSGGHWAYSYNGNGVIKINKVTGVVSYERK